MLLCDEATSALDSKTEREILGALQQLAAGRTSLFVAHRLSTAAQADKIVVLDHVRVPRPAPPHLKRDANPGCLTFRCGTAAAVCCGAPGRCSSGAACRCTGANSCWRGAAGHCCCPRGTAIAAFCSDCERESHLLLLFLWAVTACALPCAWSTASHL